MLLALLVRDSTTNLPVVFGFESRKARLYANPLSRLAGSGPVFCLRPRSLLLPSTSNHLFSPFPGAASLSDPPHSICVRVLYSFSVSAVTSPLCLPLHAIPFPTLFALDSPSPPSRSPPPTSLANPPRKSRGIDHRISNRLGLLPTVASLTTRFPPSYSLHPSGLGSVAIGQDFPPLPRPFDLALNPTKPTPWRVTGLLRLLLALS